MSDGSNYGIDADRALKTILGGEESPTEDEEQTPEQVRARIMSATGDTYSGATDCIARAVLRLFEQRPETLSWPISPECAWTMPDGRRLTNDEARAEGIWARYVGMKDPQSGAEWLAEGPVLSDAVKEIATPEERKAYDECTGFMWGFAVNQARWLLGRSIGSNPAIIEIG